MCYRVGIARVIGYRSGNRKRSVQSYNNIESKIVERKSVGGNEANYDTNRQNLYKRE